MAPSKVDQCRNAYTFFLTVINFAGQREFTNTPIFPFIFKKLLAFNDYFNG